MVAGPYFYVIKSIIGFLDPLSTFHSARITDGLGPYIHVSRCKEGPSSFGVICLFRPESENQKALNPEP